MPGCMLAWLLLIIQLAFGLDKAGGLCEEGNDNAVAQQCM
jgi:hypothetical protein